MAEAEAERRAREREREDAARRMGMKLDTNVAQAQAQAMRNSPMSAFPSVIVTSLSAASAHQNSLPGEAQHQQQQWAL